MRNIIKLTLRLIPKNNTWQYSKFQCYQKQGKSEELSHIQGDEGDVTTKCKVESWIVSDLRQND